MRLAAAACCELPRTFILGTSCSHAISLAEHDEDMWRRMAAAATMG
ncbi:MAG TPA: hypothetical protein VNC17_00065 [Thermoleophilaceae bacterium]|nr:hypothetical protein [Thermoleophilaceae bacterium]